LTESEINSICSLLFVFCTSCTNKDNNNNNRDELKCIMDDVNHSLNVDYLPADCIIQTHDVKSAVARLSIRMMAGQVDQ